MLPFSIFVFKSSFFMAIDIRLYFDCNSKETYVKDYTDYESSEFPLNISVVGGGNFFGPTNNQIFSSANLIEVDTAQVPNNSSEFTLPVTTSNNILPGNYNFNYYNTYTWENDLSANQKITFIDDNRISIPNVNLSLIWGAGDTFTISDATDPSNDGTYTIQEILYNSTYNFSHITVTTNTFVVPDPIETDAEALLNFSKVVNIYTDKIYTYTSCSSVTPCISANYDCTSTPYGNITFEDSSTYPTGVVADTKEFTIYYPNGLDPAQSPNPDNYPVINPIIEQNVSFVSVNTLATGTWSAKLILNTSQAQADGLILINSSSSIKEFNVSCTSNMCGLSSCLTKLKDRHISYLKSSTVSPLQQYVDNVQLLYTMAKEAQACGDKNTYEKYIAEIFAVVKQTDTDCGCGCSGSCSGSCDCGGCDDGCGCGETGPTWVNNIGVDINSLLQDLEGIPDQVAALQTTVDGFSDDISSLNTWTGLGNYLPGGGNLYDAVGGLLNTTSTLGTQVNNNTGDITGLQTQVDNLDSEVNSLQEQIDNISNLSSSDSEISTYELMTNSGAQKSVWTATQGTADSSLYYSIIIPTNVTSDFPFGTKVSFFNPTTSSWFCGEVGESTFSQSSTIISVAWTDTINFPAGASWQNSNQSFLVYKGQMNNASYNFQTTLYLDNDSYWKYDTENVKYWSKIKASFVVNEPTINGQKPIFTIKNSTLNKTIDLRDLPCGSIVDLELSFEKLYDQPTQFYDRVTLIDVKYNTSDNVAIAGDNELVFGGYSGFNPNSTFGIDLYRANENYDEIGITETLENSSFVQDVVNASGGQNTNRKISRYATGPSYPLNSGLNFFTGTLSETIVFNFGNINITLFNIEQSFGKMLVNLA